MEVFKPLRSAYIGSISHVSVSADPPGDGIDVDDFQGIATTGSGLRPVAQRTRIVRFLPGSLLQDSGVWLEISGGVGCR